MMKKSFQILSLLLICISFMGFLGIGGNRNVNDIIKLLKAKVGEEVIKSHITHKDLTFDLTTNDIVNLKKVGASDNLLSFMMEGNAFSEFPFDIEKEFIVRKPVVHNQIAIFPVFKKTPVTVEDYITLDEAQDRKVIIIKEKESGSVPVVIIENIGRKSIFIMAGEIIIGGKQDRMTSHDVLIPTGKKIEVSVRCVEHGRWQGKSYEFKSGGAIGSGNVRSALQFKNQQEVWNQVGKKCKEHNAETSTGTYRALLSSEDIKLRSKPYFDALRPSLENKDMVGMIIALNGEIVCVDIFANPSFFGKIREKLLKSYILDAISTKETSTEVPKKKEILDFFSELKVARIEQSIKYKANCNYEMESEKLIGNESKDDDGNLQHLNLYKQ